MKTSLRSKLGFAGCLAGISVGVIVFGSLEFDRMRARSLPAEIELVPTCAFQAAKIALLEHEAATNQRLDDDYWLSPTTVHAKRMAFRRDWEPVVLVGQLGSVPLAVCAPDDLHTHEWAPVAVWRTVQHVRLQI
jgi:hypothetical protein